ncbi:MAG: DUF2764 family protein [Mucinivorans sp.]
MYYCLISSLAELSLATDPSRIDFAQVRADIAGELSASDKKAVELLYTYYDVENLLSAMRGSDLPHNELGNLTREQIEQELTTPGTEDEPFVSLLPGAIRRSLDLYRGRVEVDEDTPKVEDIERALLLDFYRQCESSKVVFLSRWALADRSIRNTIAGSEYAIGQELVDVKEQSWFPALQAVISTTDFVEREHKMDALRWDLVDELTEGHYFDIDTVLGYIVCLNILQRWAYLNKEFGRTRFDKIVKSFTEKITI